MKLSKLNAKGFAHHFLLAIIVVGVAIVGTYYIVFSSADTLNGRFYTVASGTVYSMNADGSDRQAISNLAHFSTVEANKAGTKLLLTNGSNVFTADINGLNLQQITKSSNTADTSIDNAHWTPDGTKILYNLSTKIAGSNFYTASIVSISATGSHNTVLAKGDAVHRYDTSSVSPDGTKILYRHSEDSSDGSYNYKWETMAIDGTNQTAVPALSNVKNPEGGAVYVSSWGSPVWTDNNTIISSVYNDSGTYDNVEENETRMGSCAIASVKLDTGEFKQLFKYANFACDYVVLSPSGTSLAFSMFPWEPTGGTDTGGWSAQGGADGQKIYTLPVNGGRATVVPNSNGVRSISWAPIPAATYTASCTVNNVPATITNGQAFTPSVTINNTGTAPITVSGFNVTGTLSGATATTIHSNFGATIAPGGSAFDTTGVYKPTSKAATSGVVTATGTFADGGKKTITLTCSAPFSMSAPYVAPTYTASCTITGIPATAKKGTAFKPTVAFKNTGTGTLGGITTTKLVINPDKGSNEVFANYSHGALAPGKSVSKALTNYKFDKSSKATSAKMTVTAKISGGNNATVTCSTSFKVK